MKKARKNYAIPESNLTGSEVLINGEEFRPSMTGSFFFSSLEMSCSATPQYVNAGDLVAPVYDEVKRKLKPRRPYGVFGAIIEDEDINEFRLESDRLLVELPTRQSVEAISNKVYLDDEGGSDKSVTLLDMLNQEKFTYTTRDGGKIGLAEAIQLQLSYKEHNDSIQKQIDELVERRGYAPVYVNGRKKSMKYPDSLMAEIAQLAKQKKSVTGFNLKFQVFGKHTVATEDNYVYFSGTEQDKEFLLSKLDYRHKGTYLQGNVRFGTLNIPIQTVAQLKEFKRVMMSSYWTAIEGTCNKFGLCQIYLDKCTSQEVSEMWNRLKGSTRNNAAEESDNGNTSKDVVANIPQE